MVLHLARCTVSPLQKLMLLNNRGKKPPKENVQNFVINDNPSLKKFKMKAENRAETYLIYFLKVVMGQCGLMQK